jgi:hypothetical protein
MTIPLTPDEAAVLAEYHRRNIQPSDIDKKLINEIAEACSMSLRRAEAAMLGLLEKDVFYVEKEEKRREGKKQEQILTDREIMRDLLLHDPEIKKMLEKTITEMCKQK